MSSLSGAPSLSGGPKKKFSYDVVQEADYFTSVSAEEDSGKHRSTSKDTKDRKKKDKKKKKDKTRPQSHADAHAPPPKRDLEHEDLDYTRKTTDDYDDQYTEDFEASQGSDDHTLPVESSVSSKYSTSVASAGRHVDRDEEQRRLMKLEEERIRKEREEHERNVARFQQEEERREQEWREQQAALERQMQAQHAQAASASSISEQVAKLVQEQLSAIKANGSVEEESKNDVMSLTEAQRSELQRRRQRERERALGLRRAKEEEAAHSLFQRLAQDVREVFHELNLSVVAAEKERLIKDERYRKEREMKDRREEMERSEKIQKEIKEREERDAKFWAMVEQREDKFRTFMEERMQKDDDERESRLKRDLEDRATRARNERELREDLDKIERERRGKYDHESRDRDTVILQGQVEEIKQQYRHQLEELRQQNEADRSRNEEVHRSELKMLEKRHEAAIEQLVLQQGRHMDMMESHAVNVGKLERLIENLHKDTESTRQMSERLAEERISTLHHKENMQEEQKVLLKAMMEDVCANKQDVEKERVRVAGLYAKFEIALANFCKATDDDRRSLQESQAHLNLLRQQAEKDKKLMQSELSQERRLLEQQHEDFLSKRMESLSELQAERLAISRERTDAAVARERQNRDETGLLQSLRAREEEYHSKIQAIEEDRVTISEMKREQRVIYEKAVAEREALRKERESFELEKQELLSRFEEIRQRAEDTANSQDRLRRELVENRAAREFNVVDGVNAHLDPTVSANVVSRLQMGLAKQRAILQKLS